MPRLKRTGKIHNTLTGYDFREDTALRPLKAMRMKCLECCCGSPAQVRDCHISDCALWPYRFGVRPDGIAVSEKNPNGRAAFLETETESV